MNYKKSLKPFFKPRSRFSDCDEVVKKTSENSLRGKKRHLIELLSIMVLLLIASVFKITVDNLKEVGSAGNSFATLAVNFDNLKRSFEGEVVEDMTVLDALNMAMAAGKIKLNYSLDDKNQTWIMEINDHLNKAGNRHFAFFINDKQIDSKDLNKVNLKAGDSIVIKYE